MHIITQRKKLKDKVIYFHIIIHIYTHIQVSATIERMYVNNSNCDS